MSPEQARGQELDARTDLFSFAVLYEMATGRMAFSGETPAVVMDAILNRTPIAAWRVNPELSPKLEVVIEKAIEKDRKLRYQSATDIRTDLTRLKREGQSSGATRAGVARSSEGVMPGSGTRQIRRGEVDDCRGNPGGGSSSGGILLDSRPRRWDKRKY
jgi:serine/threonine protein kinase